MRDTIELAREAGIIDFRDAFSEEHVQAVLQDLKNFEALVRADEREALIEITQDLLKDDPFDYTASAIQLAIKSRGNT